MAMRATSVFRAACRACVGACVVVVVAVLGLVQVAPFSAQASEPGVSVFPVRGGGELLGSSVFAGDSGPAHADVKLELVVPRDALGASGFTYTATVSNQGPAGADGTRFSVEFEPGTSEISWECTPPDTTTSSAPVDGEAAGSAGAGEGLSPEGTTPGSGSVATVPAPGLGVAGRDSFVGSGVSGQTSASRAQVFGANGGFAASVGPRSAETTGRVPTVNALASSVLDAGIVGVAPSVGAGFEPASGVGAESVRSGGRRGFVTEAGHSVTGSGYSGLGFGHGDMLGRAAVSRGAVSSAVFASPDLGSSSASDAESGSEGVAPSVGAGSESAAGVGGEGGPVVASCPVDVEIKEGAGVAVGERPRLSGRIESLPVEGQVVFTLKGKFPNNKTSASAVFTAELPAGIVDDNPATNRVEQQTALIPVFPSIRVTKTQDKEITLPGETRTYTITYENTGTSDVNIKLYDYLNIWGVGDHSGLRFDASGLFSYSYGCDHEASTARCHDAVPAGHMLRMRGDHVYYYAGSSTMMVPAGKKIVVKTTIAIDESFCIKEAGTLYLKNSAWATMENILIDEYNRSSGYPIEGKVLNIPACPRPQVAVTKTQDKETTALGEERTYTVTYENTGDFDAEVLISDNIVNADGRVYASGSFSTECDETASTVSCDSLGFLRKDSYVSTGFSPFYKKEVTIPAGKKVVLKIKFTMHEDSCLSEAGDLEIKNTATVAPRDRIPVAEGSVTEASVSGRVLNLPACPRPQIKVTQTQEKEVLLVGEEQNYTVTYENTGDVDAVIYMRDYFLVSKTSLTYSVECDQEASTMQCSDDFTIWRAKGYFGRDGTLLQKDDVRIPAGKKLVFKAKVQLGEEMCSRVQKSSLLNVAFAELRNSNVKFAEGSKTSSGIRAQVRCSVDVSTTTVLSDYSPRVGEFVDVVSQVSNSAGLAEDVPFWLQLPVDDRSGRKVDVLSVDVAKDVVCEVEVGDGECPTGFTYDAQANAVVGVIPRLPLGSAVKIKARTLLTTGAKFLKTYDVFAQTPGIFADFHLGPEGSNRSSTTFSWSEIVTILIPDTPVEVEDPCGVGNAVWVKPEDTYTLRWEVTDQGHLVVYPQEGYVFEGGQVSHDFGVPVDSGQLCWIQPLAIPMTGGKAADTLYAAGLLLLVAAACGAGLKKRHNTRVRTYTAPH